MKLAILSIFLCTLASPSLAQFRSDRDKAVLPVDSAVLKDSNGLELQFTSPKAFLKNQLAFGGTIGSPGGLNFISEGYYGPFGLRAEVGAFALPVFVALFGWQADLSYVLLRAQDALLELSGVFLETYTSGADSPNGFVMKGFGIALAFDVGGFFLEIGPGHTWDQDFNSHLTSAPHGLINSLPMVVQVGYVH